MNRATGIDDVNGDPVFTGDTVAFSYGIPSAGVRGSVVDENDEFWVLTPGHNPDRIKLTSLRSSVGDFWVVYN